MPSCVYRKCTNYTATVRDANNISFHSFPTDILITEKWIKIIRAQRREYDWMPTKHSKVCSDHFHPNDIYVTDKNLRRLKKTAIPFIKQEEVYMVSTSPNSLECVNISDEESIFDSPTTAFLKSKIEKISLNKRKLQLKNYNLARINKRLKERCKNSFAINKRRLQLIKYNLELLKERIKEKCSNSKVIDKRRKNYNLARKYKRNKKCNNLKEIVLKLQKKNFFTIDQLNELSIKAEAVEFANRLIPKIKPVSCREKYSPELRKFAVTLHYYSVAAYKLARQLFNGTLPHPRDIGKWYEKGFDEPGFNKQALNMLRKKYKYRGKRIICTLIADEIALRHETLWNGKMSAVVDFGVGPSKSCEIATKAYVFTLVGINESWKIPVAYFLVNGLPAETRANLLKTCLSECYDVGVDIVCITFDGCTANINAANLLGCDLKNPSRLKTTFKHPDCGLEVAIMLDPCHMIKLVRNSLECRREIFDGVGKPIRWQLLINLINLEKNTGLNFESKITPQHLNFRNQIIKVKLATQIMSISVANVLQLCNEILKSSLFIDTEGTVNFVTLFNNLFDIFNSKSSDLYDFKKPLSEENGNKIMAYLEIAKQYILRLNIYIKYRYGDNIRKQTTIKVDKKKIVESKNKTGFLGFLICIESLKHLYSTLVKGQRLPFIETYRLSQDHIDISFGSIRFAGYNNNPNAIEFRRIFNNIVHHLVKSSFSGNCIPLEDIHMLASSSAIDNINSSVNRRANDEEYESFNENQIIEGTSTIDENVKVFSTMLGHERVKKTTNQIIGYISGWISRKLIKLLECETCTESLMSNNKLWFHKLIVLKYIGGLCLPSEDVFKICLQSELVIKCHLKVKDHLIFQNTNEVEKIKTRILSHFINSDIFTSLSLHSLEQHPILNHRLHLIRAIIEKFVDVRIHFIQQELL